VLGVSITNVVSVVGSKKAYEYHDPQFQLQLHPKAHSFLLLEMSRCSIAEKDNLLSLKKAPWINMRGTGFVLIFQLLGTTKKPPGGTNKVKVLLYSLALFHKVQIKPVIILLLSVPYKPETIKSL